MEKLCKIVILIFAANYLNAQPYYYSKQSPLPCVNKNFSVYFHIVLDSTGKNPLTPNMYYGMIDQLNQTFAPICIQFTLCELNLIKEYSFEKIGKKNKIDLMVNRWHQKNRINIYIVKNVGFENSYSEYYGISDPEKGIVVVPRSGIGLIHEMGNLFGLYHTFDTQFGKEMVDGSNCKTSGDLICDTPADPFTKDYSLATFINSRCQFVYNKKDTNDDYYLTEIGNYMSHYYCAHCFFTKEQYHKMANNYFTAPFKMW